MTKNRIIPATKTLSSMAIITVAIVIGYIGYSISSSPSNHNHPHGTDSASNDINKSATGGTVHSAKINTSKTETTHTHKSAQTKSTDIDTLGSKADETIDALADESLDTTTTEPESVAPYETAATENINPTEPSQIDTIASVTNDDDIPSPLSELLGLNASNQNSFEN